MSKGVSLMKQDLAGRPGLGMGSWNHLINRGWDPQQIAALGPKTGWTVGSWAQGQMDQYPNAHRNIGQSGLYNLMAAQKWAGRGKTQQEIEGYGTTLSGTPRGQATGLSGWKAGFTPEAADWITNHFRTEPTQEVDPWREDFNTSMQDLADRINTPAADPSKNMPGYRQDYAVGKGGAASMKIEPKGRRHKTDMSQLKRKAWSMTTTNTAAGKGGGSPVNV